MASSALPAKHWPDKRRHQTSPGSLPQRVGLQHWEPPTSSCWVSAKHWNPGWGVTQGCHITSQFDRPEGWEMFQACSGALAQHWLHPPTSDYHSFPAPASLGKEHSKFFATKNQLLSKCYGQVTPWGSRVPCIFWFQFAQKNWTTLPPSWGSSPKLQPHDYAGLQWFQIQPAIWFSSGLIAHLQILFACFFTHRSLSCPTFKKESEVGIFARLAALENTKIFSSWPKEVGAGVVTRVGSGWK